MDMALFYFDKRTIARMLKSSGFQVIERSSYRHIITLEYLFLKLDSLGVKGSRYLRALVGKTPLKNIMVPFYIGDIQMYVCKAADKTS